jgi:hypothetical protein
METFSNLPLLLKILVAILAVAAGLFLLRLIFQFAGLILRVGCFLLVAGAILWLLLKLFNIW